MKKTNQLLSLTIIAAIVLAILFNLLIAFSGDVVNLQVDMTDNQVFKIDETTRDTLASFETPLVIKVLAKEDTFMSNSIYNAQANQIFHEFEFYGKHINLEYIDFISDPSIASKYPDLQIKHGDILLETNQDVYHVATENLFNYSYTAQGQPVIASSKAEEVLLGGMLALISDIKPKLAVLSGHGEYDMTEFVKLMERNNYEVIKINLLSENLTSDIDALVMFAPKNDLSLEELGKIDAFLENDGNYQKLLFYTGDPSQPALENLAIFLSEWGIEVGSGSVFETNENRVYNYQPFYALVDYVDIEFEDKLLSASIPMVMPLSRPLKVLFDNRNNYSTRILTEFSKTSGVRPEDAPNDFTADMATIKGPLPALVLGSRRYSNKADSPTSYLLVSGSTAMLDEFALVNASFSNASYILNVFNHFIQPNQHINVLPKQILGKSLNLSKLKADTIGSIFVFGGPLMMVVGAIFVYVRRKSL